MPTASFEERFLSLPRLINTLVRKTNWERKIMKLSYLGVNYQEGPSTLEVTEREMGGIYRSQNRQFGYVRHIPEPLPMQDRKYRGIAYRNAKPATEAPTVVAKPVPPVPPQTFPTRNKCEVLEEMMNSHLRNIHRSLEHRLQVARAKGDQKLVRLLEAESEQMVCTFQ
jgi:hypothetical protein